MAMRGTVLWAIEPPTQRADRQRHWSEQAVIHFDVDRDDPALWPREHPGPLDARHGWREHRIHLAFALDQPPTGTCTLQLEFDAGNGPCPDLAVQVGAHRGVFHPVVVRPTRDRVPGTGPTAGSGTLEVIVPGSWWRPGANTLTLTTVLDGVLADAEKTSFHRAYDSFGSSLQWRSLRLLAGSTQAALSATVEATPFFVAMPDGERELVEVAIRVPPAGPWPDSGTLQLDGNSYPLELARADRTFGEIRVRVAVPNFTGPVEATVEIGGFRHSVTVAPCRKWTLHLIPHVHLDVGYTDYQGKVLELHSRNLDRAMAIHERNEGFRFTADGALIVGEFLDTRRPEERERLLTALRSREIGMNAFHSLFLSGLPTLEELYRYAYLSADLRAAHGIPVDYANLTDVPSYSMAIPSVLRALGIDCFVGIENHGRGANQDSDLQHELSPVWWEGPDGSRVLTYFSDQYSQLRHMAGDPQTIAGATQSIGRFLARYERDDYLPTDLPIVGSHCDNEDLAAGDIGLVARWNATYSWPRLNISTFTDYFAAVRPLGDDLPAWHGDGGSYWEDGVGTAATAMVDYRRAQMLLPLAENLAALVGMHDRATQPNRAALDQGWDGLLIGAEHTWTWSHAYHHPGAEQTRDQESWKRHRIADAQRVGVDELRRGMSRLAAVVTTRGPSLLAYNGLSWPRSLDLELDLAADVDLEGAGAVVECLDSEQRTDGRLDRVRVSVPDVPAFGYRVLPLARKPSRPAAGGWEPVGDRMRTERWEVSFDPSGTRVTGLVHRPTGRQLLDPTSAWGLGDVLYASSGAEADRFDRNSISGADPSLPPAPVDVTPAALGRIVTRRVADGWRLRASGHAPSLPGVRVEILLRDATDRVDVSVTLEKQRVLRRESVYVAFPFAARNPRVRWDRQQGWVDPATDHTPGACNEWFTIGQAVSVDGGDGGVTWTSADAPLFTVGDVVRGTWPTRFPGNSATVLSWVMNNYWPTNTPPSQEGTMTLRYAFTPTVGFDPATASRFGREVRTPAGQCEVTWLDKDDTAARLFDAPAAGLLDLAVPDTVHATVFQARRVDGLLIRLQELSGVPQAVSVISPFGAHGTATLCHADERPLTGLAIGDDATMTVNLARYGTATMIVTGPAPTDPPG